MSTDCQKTGREGRSPLEIQSNPAACTPDSVGGGLAGELAPPSTGLFDKLRSEMSIRGPVRWRGFAGPRVHAGNVKEA